MVGRRQKQFAKLVKYQQRRVETLKQQLAVENLRRDESRAVIARRRAQLQQLSEQANAHCDSLALLQQSAIAMQTSQESIDAGKNDLAAIEKNLESLVESYRTEYRRLESWQRILERAATQLAMDASRCEMRQADERYLWSQIDGATS